VATVSGITVATERGIVQTTWTGFATSGDVGTAEQLSRYPIKNVQIGGTFTGSPTLVLEGSEDGVTYFTVMAEYVAVVSTAPTAGDAPVTAAAASYFGQLGTNPRFIRPRCSAGSGGANLFVILTSKAFGN